MTADPRSIGLFGKLITQLVILSWVLFLPILVLRYVDMHFMPSPDSFWVRTGWIPAIVGAVMALIAFPYMLRNPKADKSPSFSTKATLFVFSLAMTAFSINLGVKVVIPMASAGIAMEDTIQRYTVVDPASSGSRRTACSSAVQTELSVFIFNELCGVPPEMRRSLSVGDTIKVYGKGSEHGVFYDSFRKGRQRLEGFRKSRKR